jgi:hypothetical protein
VNLAKTTEQAPKKRGRPDTGRALSVAERQRRYREKRELKLAQADMVLNSYIEQRLLTEEAVQSITYRAFELAESAIKAAIAQAIEEQFND